MAEESSLVTGTREDDDATVPRMKKTNNYNTPENYNQKAIHNLYFILVLEPLGRSTLLLTLDAHAQRGLQYLVCVCVCLLLNISLFMCLFMPQTILTFSAADEGRKF